jgi:DNA polymerase III subunit gamma/tau
MTDAPADHAPSLLPPAAAPRSAPYRVLARRHRPQRFSELIGQSVLVRSLTNAIHSGRVAHAFLLTGIRGVGKTTTARIIARALNCIGPDGEGGPTPEPCGVCEHCRAIAEDRHIDVLEMDAATRTGIDDIREIVDSVRYAPTSARCKVYIIDEVHMLSEKAFNGLLKTLEEPPPQAKFIFATTEVRKVPVTILSRCQRFDLRRVDGELIARHLAEIALREEVTVEPEAIALIARAAEGSVRDALSLLDQAIALSGAGGANAVGLAQVQDMLGLADRTRLLDLFELAMRGDVAGALELLGDLYDLGCEPETVLHDLLEICHRLTRHKVAPEGDGALTLGQADVERSREMAAKLPLPVLARTWQMLLKGLDELRLAPDALRAAEMVLVRLAFAADLPTPGDLLRLTGGGEGGARAAPPGAQQASERARPRANGGAMPAPAAAEVVPAPLSFAEAVQLFQRHDQPMLHRWLHDQVGLVHYEPGRIELRAEGHVPADWPRRVAACLSLWTGRAWSVQMGEAPGAASLGAQASAVKQARLQALAADPRIRPVLDTFPGAQIVDVRSRAPIDMDPTSTKAETR